MVSISCLQAGRRAREAPPRACSTASPRVTNHGEPHARGRLSGAHRCARRAYHTDSFDWLCMSRQAKTAWDEISLQNSLGAELAAQATTAHQIVQLQAEQLQRERRIVSLRASIASLRSYTPNQLTERRAQRMAPLILGEHATRRPSSRYMRRAPGRMAVTSSSSTLQAAASRRATKSPQSCALCPHTHGGVARLRS